MLGARPYVMDAEQLVIDDAFEDVERAPADENEPVKHAPRRHAVTDQRETREDHDQHRGVEEAVRERVHLEAVLGRDRPTLGAREHVVPLENLMEEDPIDEPAEANAEQGRAPEGSSRHRLEPARRATRSNALPSRAGTGLARQR